MTKCDCGYRHGTYSSILRYNDINITYRSNNGIKRNLQAVSVPFYSTFHIMANNCSR